MGGKNEENKKERKRNFNNIFTNDFNFYHY